MQIDSNIVVYGVGQMEMGASGTPHAQVYVVTRPNPKNKNGYSLSWVKENIHKTAHWEKRRGTHEQARVYCMKDATRINDDIADHSGPFEVGQWDVAELQEAGGQQSGQKHASKLLSIKEKIDDGVTDDSLYEDHFSEMLRYKKSFDMYRLTKSERFRSFQTKAVWIWGPAHTGKSHRAREFALKIDNEPYYLDLSGGNIWFDGMKVGCKCIVIEDFRGNAAISFMLKLLDHTPMQVNTKGSMLPFSAEWVIFTSNSHPRDVYGQQSENKIPLEVLNAWHNRFEGTRGTILEMKEVFKSASVEADVKNMFDEIEAFDGVVDLTQDSDAEEVAEYLDDIDHDDDLDDDLDDKEPEEEQLDDWFEEEGVTNQDRDTDSDYDEHMMSSGVSNPIERTLSFHKELPKGESLL